MKTAFFLPENSHRFEIGHGGAGKNQLKLDLDIKLKLYSTCKNACISFVCASVLDGQYLWKIVAQKHKLMNLIFHSISAQFLD